MASVIMVKPALPMAGEGRWKCEVCGKEFGYTQPISFQLQLDMLKVFMDWHDANCQGFMATAGPLVGKQKGGVEGE